MTPNVTFINYEYKIFILISTLGVGKMMIRKIIQYQWYFIRTYLTRIWTVGSCGVQQCDVGLSGHSAMAF